MTKKLSKETKKKLRLREMSKKYKDNPEFQKVVEKVFGGPTEFKGRYSVTRRKAKGGMKYRDGGRHQHD